MRLGPSQGVREAGHAGWHAPCRSCTAYRSIGVAGSVPESRCSASGLVQVYFSGLQTYSNAQIHSQNTTVHDCNMCALDIMLQGRCAHVKWQSHANDGRETRSGALLPTHALRNNALPRGRCRRWRCCRCRAVRGRRHRPSQSWAAALSQRPLDPASTRRLRRRAAAQAGVARGG